VFNLTMLVMAISQAWLDDPLGALGTLAVLILSIVVNAAQQIFASRRVSQIALQAQPFATAVRDARLQSITLDEIVPGDVLAIGPGDEILANGVVLESKGLVLNDLRLQTDPRLIRAKGEQVQAGSICENGQAVYRVSQVPPVHSYASFTRSRYGSAKKRTHLESILLRVLFILLGISGIFYLLLLSELLSYDLLSPEQMKLSRDVMGIIFSLAPTGFFLMIVVNYAMGTIDLARQGALVRDSRAIETLAQLTTFCIHDRSAFSNLDIRTEMIPTQSERPALAENFTRRLLGDIAHSVAATNIVLTAIREGFEGQRRNTKQEAFFFSLNGWGAVTFADPDLRGTFVIGYPDILKNRLVKPPSQKKLSTVTDEEGQGREPSLVGRLRKRFGGAQDHQTSAPANSPPPSDNPQVISETRIQDGPDTAALPSADEPPKKGLFSRFGASIQGFVKKIAEAAQNNPAAEDEVKSVLDLIVAYLPEPVDLFNSDGSAVLPKDLVPVCQLRFSEQLQTDLANTLEAIRNEGINVKFFARELTDQTLAQATQAGLIAEGAAHSVLSAEELEKLNSQQIGQVVKEASLFHSLNNGAKGLVVRSLRESGEYVGVLGDSVQDVKSLQNADLAIVRQNSAQALLNRADMVLMRNSQNVIKNMLERGQQIVHGTLDVIKLNLVQIGYVLLLLAIMFALGETHFVYNGAQGGMVAFFTVTLPAIALTLWARKGAVNQGSMRMYLARFIAPPAITIAIAVLIVFREFLSSTQDYIYTQHVVTHALVSMGLLLVVFARPTTKWLAAGDRLTRDPRPVIAAAVIFVLWNGFVWIGLVQKYLFVAPLASLQDYLTVWTAALIWGAATQLIWRLPWLSSGVDFLSSWLETKEETGPQIEAQSAG
jgi:magnesium-transporting ATPase (P-type)